MYSNKCDTDDYPKITVVTPSFNQGQYLEDTILSVIGQCYPNLEYIVMDGGSTDDSVQIIKKYEKHISYWISEKDAGQSQAINRGFEKSTGDIIGWLNSDDMYLPGTLHYAAQQLNTDRQELILGNCFHFVENTAKAYGSDVKSFHGRSDLRLIDYISQPSTFWTQSAWQAVGALDETLTYVFDWDWYVRAQSGGVTFKPIDRYLSMYRIHEAHKTGTGGDRRMQEVIEILQRYAGEKYVSAFQEILQNRSRIAAYEKWTRRLRIPHLTASLVKRRYSKHLASLTEQDILDMLIVA